MIAHTWPFGWQVLLQTLFSSWFCLMVFCVCPGRWSKQLICFHSQRYRETFRVTLKMSLRVKASITCQVDLPEAGTTEVPIHLPGWTCQGRWPIRTMSIHELGYYCQVEMPSGRSTACWHSPSFFPEVSASCYRSIQAGLARRLAGFDQAETLPGNRLLKGGEIDKTWWYLKKGNLIWNAPGS